MEIAEQNKIERRVLDVDLLLFVIRKRRALVAVTTLALLLLTVLYLQLAPRKYTVSMQVAPAANSTQASNSGLSALTKLAGVNLPDASGGAVQFRLFLTSLTARDTADLISENQPLMRAMFPKEWNSAEQKWVEPFSLIRPVTHLVARVLGYPVNEWSPPDGARLATFLNDHLEIYEDPKSPVVTLSNESDAPQVSRRLLLTLTETADSLLRRRALQRANDYVGYLSRELNKETVAQYREALMAHLAEQEQTLMMANASVSFAFQVFSAPSIPRSPSSPKAAILLVSSIVFGVIFGVILAVAAEMRAVRRGRAVWPKSNG
jgi:uncharacterized protein involved in exopolysaccharide biosynthesis